MSQNPSGSGAPNASPGSEIDQFKKLTSYKFELVQLDMVDKNKRDAQIAALIAKAKAIGTFAYIGFPFEAKNAPFKMRAAAPRELEVA